MNNFALVTIKQINTNQDVQKENKQPYLKSKFTLCAKILIHNNHLHSI